MVKIDYKKFIGVLILSISWMSQLQAQNIERNEHSTSMAACTDMDSFLETVESQTKSISKKSFFFASQMENKRCPADCQQKSYLVVGDEVMVGEVYGEYVCVAYKVKDKKLEYMIGWLKKDTISNLLPSSQLDHYSVGFWVQSNEYRHISIYIEEREDGLWMYGENVFKTGSEQSMRIYATEGTLIYDNGIYKVHNSDVESECEYIMRRYGDFLLVEDYGLCLIRSDFSLSGVYMRE